MTLGEKIRLARLEAGLSQRQLAGQEMTRNMLSQLEHDTARPSLGSLQYLARQLGKNVSYFLEEEGAAPQTPILRTARDYFAQGEFRSALEALMAHKARFQEPEPELALLENLCRMELARKSRQEGRVKYARELLSSRENTVYWNRSLRRQWEMECCLCGLSPQMPAPENEWVDAQARELLLQEPERAGAVLDAFPRPDSQWHWLRGQVYEKQREWAKAVACYLQAEKDRPREVLPRLEKCYEALEDYRNAYACARRLRDQM